MGNNKSDDRYGDFRRYLVSICYVHRDLSALSRYNRGIRTCRQVERINAVPAVAVDAHPTQREP
jgi:hypothetical protein